MEPLTKRQSLVLDFIVQSIDARGYPPTMREIGQHLGIRSTNGVNDHLKALERKGYIHREDLKSRTLRPVAATPRTLAVPLLGRVAAGRPIQAVEHREEVLHVDAGLLGASSGDVFALRVKGDSMIEDGILDGDVVFVRQQDTALAGEVVVALVDDDVTVKRYYPENGAVRLQPANSAMEPIRVVPSARTPFRLLGVVSGVFRKL
jgi:repressor LexA